MIYKTIKRCRVQQLAYLVTEICSKYMQPVKWKVKYLPYKEYDNYNNYITLSTIASKVYTLDVNDMDLMSTAFYKRVINLINLMNMVANHVGPTCKSKLSRKIQT